MVDLLAFFAFFGGDFGDLVIKWDLNFDSFFGGGIKLDAQICMVICKDFPFLLVPSFGVGQYNDSCLVGVGTKEISKELVFGRKRNPSTPEVSKSFFPIFSPSKHVFFPGIPSQKFPSKKSSPPPKKKRPK